VAIGGGMRWSAFTATGWSLHPDKSAECGGYPHGEPIKHVIVVIRREELQLFDHAVGKPSGPRAVSIFTICCRKGNRQTADGHPARPQFRHTPKAAIHGWFSPQPPNPIISSPRACWHQRQDRLTPPAAARPILKMAFRLAGRERIGTLPSVRQTAAAPRAAAAKSLEARRRGVLGLDDRSRGRRC